MFRNSKRNTVIGEEDGGSLVEAGLELSNRSFQEIPSRIPCQDLSLLQTNKVGKKSKSK